MNPKLVNLPFILLSFLCLVVIPQAILNSNSLLKMEEVNFFYEAHRYYDPKLSRFAQPDTVVPTLGAIDLNRFAYVRNNPIKYNDPSGHVPNDVLDNVLTTLKKTDKALHNITEGLTQALFPDIRRDPLGFFLAFGTISPSRAGGASDDIAKALKDPDLFGGGATHPLASAGFKPEEYENVKKIVYAFQRQGQISPRVGIDDLEQEVLFQLFMHKGKTPVYARGAWLGSFVRNHHSNLLRSVRSATRIHDQFLDIPGDTGDMVSALQTVGYSDIAGIVRRVYNEEIERIIAEGVIPEGRYTRQEQSANQAKALKAQVAILRFNEGHEIKDIAQRLGVSRKTAGKHANAIMRDLGMAIGRVVANELNVSIEGLEIRDRSNVFVDQIQNYMVNGGD